MTDHAALVDWVERYRLAWGSNDPAAIAALFTEDAVYSTEPYHPPWRGHAEIVEGWLAHRDEPGDFAFRFEVIAECDGLGFLRGWTDYTVPEPHTYSNLWVVELAADGRASEFTEWWMKHD
jgi:ketosteroid isomerase-like protein